jgi:hypothetical protein
MSTARSFAVAASLALALGGCGFGDGSGGTYDDGTTHYTGPAGGAKLLIAWTLDGAEPSATACAGIDHLVLGLSYAGESVAISPIPCDLTRFRYDGLPEGHAVLSLGAYDRDERCLLANASDIAILSAALPDEPAPVLSLPAARPCR